MTLLEGSVAASGTFAYVAQQAWILNATLRDNILFGKEFDEERQGMFGFCHAFCLGHVRCKTTQVKSAGSSQTSSLILGLFVSFRYNSVLNSCCLRPDLAILPNSDLTEVQAFCPWWGVCFAERILAGLCQSHLLGVHLKCMREKPTQWDSLSLGLYVRKYLYLRAGIINTLCFKHIKISYFTWILNQIPLLVQS